MKLTATDCKEEVDDISFKNLIVWKEFDLTQKKINDFAKIILYLKWDSFWRIVSEWWLEEIDCESQLFIWVLHHKTQR